MSYFIHLVKNRQSRMGLLLLQTSFKAATVFHSIALHDLISLFAKPPLL